jgi:NADP-dependent 3-hydroxy acid dehydrogenase YdfG
LPQIQKKLVGTTLLTGASSGINWAVASALAAEVANMGVNLIFLDYYSR